MLVQQTPTTNPHFTLKLSPIPLQSTSYTRKNIILQAPSDPAIPPLQNTPSFLDSNPLINLLLRLKENPDFLLKNHLASQTITEPSVTKDSEGEKSELSLSSPHISRLSTKSKKICKMEAPAKVKDHGKKTYEISRFFVKNYVGALKATLNSSSCESDIMDFLGCTKEHIGVLKQELEKLLKENPKHNRMQLYKLIVNPILNPAFQYFLRRKVVSWIFSSSKMQDKQAHLMARKNFLHLCLKANELTPYNFKIALNF